MPEIAYDEGSNSKRRRRRRNEDASIIHSSNQIASDCCDDSLHHLIEPSSNGRAKISSLKRSSVLQSSPSSYFSGSTSAIFAIIAILLFFHAQAAAAAWTTTGTITRIMNKAMIRPQHPKTIITKPSSSSSSTTTATSTARDTPQKNNRGSSRMLNTDGYDRFHLAAEEKSYQPRRRRREEQSTAPQKKQDAAWRRSSSSSQTPNQFRKNSNNNNSRNDRMNTVHVKNKNNVNPAAVRFNSSLKQLLNHRYTTTTEEMIQQAERILLEKLYAANSNDNNSDNINATDFDTVSFNIVLQAWARQQSLAGARRADELLSIMLQAAPHYPSYMLQPDSYSYAAVLHAYAKSGGKVVAARRATELLHQLLTNKHITLATDICHNAVMDAWAVSGDVRAGERAEQLLRQLQSSQQWDDASQNSSSVSSSASSNSFGPTRISYNACIKAWSRSGQPKEAQRLLRELQQLSEIPGNQHLRPDKISFSTCIDAWASITNIAMESTTSIDLKVYAAQQAEALMAELEELYSRTGDPSLRPDVVAYTSVLTAHAKSGQADTKVALSMLRRMQQCASNGDGNGESVGGGGGRNYTPNAAFLNAWIHLLAKSPTTPSLVSSSNGFGSASTAALDMLRYMQREYEKGNDNLRPCKITYTAVISVFAQEGTVHAAEMAEQLLDELETLHSKSSNSPSSQNNGNRGDLSYLPNSKTFACVLNAWAKSCSPVALDRAEKLLDRMQHLYEQTESDELAPNLIVFSQIFQLLANCGGGENVARTATFAKDLVHQMNELHRAGYPNVQPDASTYAYLINTFTKSKVENVAELATVVLSEVEQGYLAGLGNLKPTGLLYSAVLQAYAKSASKEGADLAENLLQRTKQMYKEGKIYAKPTTLFYNAVMDAYARSNGGRAAAERAEELLKEMDTRASAGDASLQPKTRSYNAAILAWKNSNDQEAPQRAEALLRAMNNRYKAGDENCRPDRVTINSVIGTWAKSSDDTAAERAEEFLNFMEQQYKNGDLSLKPDAWSFNTCIAAFARSKRADAAGRATRLYERMRLLYEAGDEEMRPDLITLTSLRRVWSGNRVYMQACDVSRLEKMMEALNEMVK